MLSLVLIAVCFNSPAFTYIRNLSTSSIKLFFLRCVYSLTLTHMYQDFLCSGRRTKQWASRGE